MIVKVCGVRTAEVAEAAIAAGADWIGVMLVPESPRYANDLIARSLVRWVDGRADLVGVLVSPTAAECDAAAERYHLAAVQVHGDVDRDIVDAASVTVIRGLNVAGAHQAYTVDWWPGGLLLLDSAPMGPGSLPGGTGRRLPLDLAAEVARHRDIILAGGLGPQTVAAAIAAVRPLGVDASSGLETSPGEKDPALVAAFVAEARSAAARQFAGVERGSAHG